MIDGVCFLGPFFALSSARVNNPDGRGTNRPHGSQDTTPETPETQRARNAKRRSKRRRRRRRRQSVESRGQKKERAETKSKDTQRDTPKTHTARGQATAWEIQRPRRRARPVEPRCRDTRTPQAHSIRTARRPASPQPRPPLRVRLRSNRRTTRSWQTASPLGSIQSATGASRPSARWSRTSRSRPSSRATLRSLT